MDLYSKITRFVIKGLLGAYLFKFKGFQAKEFSKIDSHPALEFKLAVSIGIIKTAKTITIESHTTMLESCYAIVFR